MRLSQNSSSVCEDVRQSPPKKVKAKFVYEGFPYYLEIKTEDATGKIEKYVNMLISQQN